MTPPKFHPLRALVPALVAMVCLLLTACTSKKGAAPKAEAKPSKSEKAPAAAAAAATVPRSTFAVDSSLRDPFFPKAKRGSGETVAKNQVPLDIPALLQKGFNGTIGSADRRIALIYEVMLEAGRSATIPIRSEGREQLISVRCLEVSRDAVVLEVVGLARRVVLTHQPPALVLLNR